MSAAIALVTVGLLVFGWQLVSGQRARATSGEEVSAATAPGVPGQPAQADTFIEAANPPADPTPYFASYKKLQLRLPVAVEDLTEVGFHQASYSYALPMKTHLAEADASKAKKAHSTNRDLSAQSADSEAKLVGEALAMWRSRPGKPDTAADVGADPGTTVVSPVDGTVVKVKKFDLYGKYPDYEIHIQPTGHPTLDCVLIHLDEVACKPGDVVVAGVTPIAKVRKLDSRVKPQLRSYTDNGGHHTHIQINDATDPDYKGLKGAIEVPAVPARTTP